MSNNSRVTRGSEEARAWARQRATEMGRGVKRARDRSGLSAAKLEEKTRELGYPITRGTIAKIESGHREGKFDVNEVVILAAALGVAPLELIYPPTPSTVEYLPGDTHLTGSALIKFADSEALAFASKRSWLQRYYDELYEKFITLRAQVEGQDHPDLDLKMQLDLETLSLGNAAEDLLKNWENLREVGLVEGDDPRTAEYERAVRTRDEWRDEMERRRRDG